MKKIAIAIFLTAFFLLRPIMMERSGLLYPNDDFDYFAHATSLAFGSFPSYQDEYIMNKETEGRGPRCAIGSGIMAAPFVFIFSFLDRAGQSDIVEKRTLQNVRQSWSAFGFIFSSVFYFSLACFLLYQSVRVIVGPSLASWAVVLMIICQGMPLFAFRRPIFSQMPEFFLQSLFVYLFIRNEMAGGQYIKKWWSYLLIGTGVGLMALTRYNNVFFALCWPLFFIGRDLWQKDMKKMFLQGFLIYFMFGILILVFKFFPEQYSHYKSYQGAESVLFVQAAWPELLRRLGHVFVGVDWGLMFTAPFLLFGLWGFHFLDVPWKRRFALATFPLFVNFYIIYISGHQGSWYGYRYLIASAFPLFVLPFACLLKWSELKTGFWWKWICIGFAAFPVLSMWCYEGNARVATQVIPVFFGKTDWGNATYQVAVWQTVFHWREFFATIYNGGIQYGHYLLAAWGVFPGIHVSPPWQAKTLIQTFCLYALPFVISWFFRDTVRVVSSSVIQDSKKSLKKRKRR